MRIAHVIAAMDYGGAERLVVDLAKVHARAGLEIAIVSPPGDLDRDWNKLGITRLLVRSARRDPVDLVAAARGVREALAHWQPDVVHAHNVKATALTLPAVRLLAPRRPLLTTLHGVASHQLRTSAAVLRFVDLVAAVSEEVSAAVIRNGLQPDRVAVVHNGVSDIPELGAGRRRDYDQELALHGLVVAIVGRLMPEKAHERFLSAAATVLQTVADVTFLIVGDGTRRRHLELLAQELGIAHAVRFTGSRDDARLLIDRADLLVVSSNREGHSLAALEALAAGTPVVSTNVGGMREMLGAGAGMIVKSWDADDLAAAITSLLNDEALRLQMGHEGRRLVAETFSTRVMTDRYVELYARLFR